MKVDDDYRIRQVERGALQLVKKLMLDGKVFYSIADTAKLLGTNSAKVREIIGRGELDARQMQINSRRFLVSGESINRLKAAKTV